MTALLALLENHAAPPPRMPAVTSATDDRWRYDRRCYHNWRRWCDDDRPSVRMASSVGPTIKAGATSALGTGVLNTGE